MRDIALSCMVDPDILRLGAFESQHFVRVHTQRIDWPRAWDELLRIALYGQGPDVSEIGSTWLSSLIGMDALRPLSAWYLGVLKRQERFFPAAQWTVTRPGDPRIWAIPLFTDTRVIYYRRDWLKRAGVEEAGAFETVTSFADTLERLQAGEIEIPWAMPTRGLEVVYTSASWVWGEGGRFHTPDGRRLRLHEPEAQAGMRAYFDLHRLLSPPARGLDIVGTDTLFRQGKAAVTISGPWLLGLLAQDAAQLSDVGIAPVPGVPFVGGMHLVSWRHARSELESIRLIEHLTSLDVQRHCFQEAGHLPSRIELLNAEPFVSDPRYQAFATSLKTGRVFAVSYRWAAVEQRLVSTLSQLWSDLAADPQLDLETEIAERIAGMNEELEQTLLAAW